MTNVTIWYEKLQEMPTLDYRFVHIPEDKKAEVEQYHAKGSKAIKEAYPLGLGGTLKNYISQMDDVSVTLVSLDMPEFGLPNELLEKTDVLIWWAHVGHDAVPDELARKIQDRVLRGMGFIALHSAHLCKPLRYLLGTSCTLQWREGDFERIFTTAPTHPIAQGIPASFELDVEEMYGEYFDIPKPDDVIFTGWFRGGEVFRSGCTWTRGYGKVFYFQPGHETNPTYHNPHVLQIIKNAIRWVAPATPIKEKIECPHAEVSPESKHQK